MYLLIFWLIVSLILTGLTTLSGFKTKDEWDKWRKSKIESKIDIKTRPFIGVEKFFIIRNNNLPIPLDSITIYLRNYGDVPANKVNIYFDIYDNVNQNLRNKIKEFPFRKAIINDSTIAPGETLKIEERTLNVGIVSDETMYENIQRAQIEKRMIYYKEHNEFPEQGIGYIVLEIKYRGLKDVEDLPFSFYASYIPKLQDGTITWELFNSEAK